MEPYRLKVLVADDAPVLRKLLESALLSKGHEVVSVADGDLAIEEFNRQSFDLVLLDIVMPNMDGFETTRLIKKIAKEQGRWVPILIVSGLEDQDNIVKGLDAGAEDFIPKPLRLEVLNAKVNAYARSVASYKRLIESEERARAISESVLDAIITADDKGTIVSVNKATESIFGYEREELIGRNVKFLMPEPFHSRHDQFIEHFLQTGEGGVIGKTSREVKGIRKDGTFIDLRLGISQVTVNGESLFIGVLSDITELKRKEEQIHRNTLRLTQLNAEITADMDMANQVMDRLIFKEALDDPQIHRYLKPAAQFSGDLIAVSRTSDELLYFMVADATGHGLAAAISVLPALWTFYGMVRKEATVPEIAAEINRRLKQVIPLGRFVSAHIASVNNTARTVRLWSGGMPAAHLIDENGGELRSLPSQHPPLGILDPRRFSPRCEIIEWQTPHQLLLHSDGLIEAQMENGPMFGEEKLKGIIRSGNKKAVLAAILEAVDAHLQGLAPQDDISILNVLLPS
jgi:PAS domain S-box-containing protein